MGLIGESARGGLRTEISLESYLWKLSSLFLVTHTIHIHSKSTETSDPRSKVARKSPGKKRRKLGGTTPTTCYPEDVLTKRMSALGSDHIPESFILERKANDGYCKPLSTFATSWT